MLSVYSEMHFIIERPPVERVNFRTNRRAPMMKAWAAQAGRAADGGKHSSVGSEGVNGVRAAAVAQLNAATDAAAPRTGHGSNSSEPAAGAAEARRGTTRPASGDAGHSAKRARIDDDAVAWPASRVVGGKARADVPSSAVQSALKALAGRKVQRRKRLRCSPSAGCFLRQRFLCMPDAVVLCPGKRGTRLLEESYTCRGACRVRAPRMMSSSRAPSLRKRCAARRGMNRVPCIRMCLHPLAWGVAGEDGNARARTGSPLQAQELGVIVLVNAKFLVQVRRLIHAHDARSLLCDDSA